VATLVHHDRPRNLPWYLAGPLLFGDIGTSRLYVLGLAIYYSGRSAPFSVGAVGLLVLMVGWAYTAICRISPDGGGVYSAGRKLHPTVGVFGAILLFTDYVVTAALSGYEAMIHITGPLGLSREWAPWLTIGALLLLAALNYIGPRRSGLFSLIVAVAAIVATLVLAGITVPDALRGTRMTAAPSGGPFDFWSHFVAVVLAISGIEAIANMTAIMVPPIGRTSKKAIWPVVAEVFTLNLLLIFAVCALPGIGGTQTLAQKDQARQHWEALPAEQRAQVAEPPPLTERDHAIQERVLEVLAKERVNSIFATIASIIFGLLLLSACNTVILDMMSVQYLMSRDRELPPLFSRLNMFGVPWWGLIAAFGLPSIVLTFARDLTSLSNLYAIGVVGAITINLVCTALSRKHEIRRSEQIGFWVIAGVLFAIWVTIIMTKLTATLFLICMLSGGMILRFVAHRIRVPVLVPAPAPEAAPAAAPAALPPILTFDPTKPRILVASRGNTRLLRFAFEEARQRNANLFVLFVREIAVLFGEDRPRAPEEDREASALFKQAEDWAREFQVPLQKIYAVSNDTPYVIVDFAATYAADLVVLGVSRRAALMRTLRGDVISQVADHLPPEATLLIHA
jgi:amino acid transporter